MASTFIGRKVELTALAHSYKHQKSQLVVIYGRRRVGKSALIREFAKDKYSLYFEGLEGGRTPEQIENFVHQLEKQLDDPLLSQMVFKSWDAVFNYLTGKLSGNKKMVIVLDELQWLAARRSKLISLLKYYWDNHWQEKQVTLILCGSIASFMVKKVLNSKALYGRISLEIHLLPLPPDEIKLLLQSGARQRPRDQEDLSKYALLFGGVPRYLEEIDLGRSFDININRLCFSDTGFMVKEFERIFYGQFSETKSYLAIIQALARGPKNLTEIAKTTKIASGGGLKSFIDNLLLADFISEYVSFGNEDARKNRKYFITDEYLNFYFKFIKPNLKLILKNRAKDVFKNRVKPVWNPWLGFVFERFCVKHAYYISEVLGFDQEILEIGPLASSTKQKAQFDLMYRRADNVIVACEIKFQDKQITTAIIPEMERKLAQYVIPRGFSLETALISKCGADMPLKESQYFDYDLTAEEIFTGK